MAPLPPGWYPSGGGLRWWNGSEWTEHRAAAVGPPTAPLSDMRRRVIAYLIDSSLSIPGVVLQAWAFVTSIVSASRDDLAGLPNGEWIFVGLGLTYLPLVVNRGVVQGVTGRTLGKKIMRLRLVRLQGGGSPGLGWGLLRLLLEGVVGIVDVILAFVTDRRQRTGDMAAKTMVMNDEDIEVWFTSA